MKITDLAIGSRFWYKDKLIEVVNEDCDGTNCVFQNNKRLCNSIDCHASDRHDNKFVCFKEVKRERN